MAAISALMINDNALRNEGPEDDKAPTTPRIASPRTPKPYDTAAESRSPQPTQPSPHASLTSQDQPHSVQESEPTPGTQGDQARSDDMDIDPVEDDDDDDQDTEPGESGSTSRKKKGQRFFCTGYPPCNLSFTRSEHLARHIRKHTGERPFQCHCNRRFSRLDNLRQHAQTVHVNEEIPTDSLAATGTRYQRQIRTDRVRPAGRPRTSTMSSTGSHSRGHSRNVSTSSIGSTSSNYDMSNEIRRRPPPLLMAGDTINRPSTPPSQFPPFPNSPADMSTPTSSTYPATPSSPGVGSTIGSPVSAISRTSGYYPSSSRTPGRRLSVPSGINQYQGIFGNPYGSQIGGPSPGPGSNFSSNSSAITSPTSSTFSFMPGYHVPPGEDWRRRTWHPSTYSGLNFNYGRPATSGLTYSQTPDAPRPAYAPNATAAAGQAPRLPGIESFDHVQHRPTTPPRRNPSPMQIDTGRQAPPLMAASELGGTRDRQRSWEGSRTGQYPDVDDSSARGVTSWGQQTIEQIHNVARPRPPYEQNSMGPPPFTNTASAHQQIAQEALHLQSPSKQTKRTGWYNGQPVGTRTSPEDSSSSDGVPTPGTSTIDVHPAIVQSNGYIESQHAMIPADAHQNPCFPQPVQGPTSFAQQQTRRDIPDPGEQGTSPHNMNRLEALVAVATSETNSSTGAR